MKKYLYVNMMIFTVFLTGCSLFYSVFFEDPEVIGYKNISVSKVGITGASLNITVLVRNNNNIDADILECNYELFVNDTYIGKGLTKKKQILHAEKVSEIVMPLDIRTSDLFGGALSLFMEVIKGKHLLYRIEGEVLGKAKGIEIRLPVSVEKKITPELL